MLLGSLNDFLPNNRKKAGAASGSSHHRRSPPPLGVPNPGGGGAAGRGWEMKGYMHSTVGSAEYAKTPLKLVVALTF
jgi:hypothetical protein